MEKGMMVQQLLALLRFDQSNTEAEWVERTRSLTQLFAPLLLYVYDYFLRVSVHTEFAIL